LTNQKQTQHNLLRSGEKIIATLLVKPRVQRVQLANNLANMQALVKQIAEFFV
jgi:hypothetical protein